MQLLIFMIRAKFGIQTVFSLNTSVSLSLLRIHRGQTLSVYVNTCFSAL